jgi:hypothetical protein
VCSIAPIDRNGDIPLAFSARTLSPFEGGLVSSLAAIRRIIQVSLLSLVFGWAIFSLKAQSNEQTPEVKFVDITSSSGLHFQHHNSATSSKYLIETMTGGVAVFD